MKIRMYMNNYYNHRTLESFNNHSFGGCTERKNYLICMSTGAYQKFPHWVPFNFRHYVCLGLPTGKVHNLIVKYNFYLKD